MRNLRPQIVRLVRKGMDPYEATGYFAENHERLSKRRSSLGQSRNSNDMFKEMVHLNTESGPVMFFAHLDL